MGTWCAYDHCRSDREREREVEILSYHSQYYTVEFWSINETPMTLHHHNAKIDRSLLINDISEFSATMTCRNVVLGNVHVTSFWELKVYQQLSLCYIYNIKLERSEGEGRKLVQFPLSVCSLIDPPGNWVTLRQDFWLPRNAITCTNGRIEFDGRMSVRWSVKS